MSFEIKSMPIPALTRSSFASKGKTKYPFADLQVGNCFVDTDFVDAKKSASRLNSALASYKRRSGDKRVFTVRTFKDDNGTDAVGVWCVSEAVAETAAAE